MAIMSRAKKALGRTWQIKNEEKAERNKGRELEERDVSEEEHKNRIKKLKEMGIEKND